jgi:hypothetical protein
MMKAVATASTSGSAVLEAQGFVERTKDGNDERDVAPFRKPQLNPVHVGLEQGTIRQRRAACSRRSAACWTTRGNARPPSRKRRPSRAVVRWVGGEMGSVHYFCLHAAGGAGHPIGTRGGPDVVGAEAVRFHAVNVSRLSSITSISPFSGE